MSEHNIAIAGGSSVRLPTGGKYCDRDIVIVAEPGGVELPNLDNPGDSADLMAGKQLIDGEGRVVDGTFTITDEITEQNSLINQIRTALQGKAAGSGEAVVPVIEPLTVTENGAYTAPDGVHGYSPVTVNVEASGGDDMAGALADRTITEFSSESCTAIGEYSFRACKKLKSLVAPNATSVGTYALYQCSALQSIVLPSVTELATNAFREASNLEVIDFSKLTAIPSNAFYGCRGLKALILRSETMVTLNSTNAFYQCYRILGTKNSGYNPNGEKLGFFYVPAALLEEYKAAANWSDSSLVTQFRAIEDYPDICG